MKRKTWYFIALFLPIALPILLYLSVLVSRPLHIYSDFLIIPIGLICYSGSFGGIQYLFFLSLVLVWARKKNAQQIGKALRFLPLLYFPICMAGMILIFMSPYSPALPPSQPLFYRKIGQPDFNVALLESLTSLFVFPIGYFYVILTHALTWLLQKAGWVKD